MKDKGRKGTRRNRHSVVGMKASVHPNEEILKGSLVMTYSFYAAAEKQTVPCQIWWSGLRLPTDVFPTTKFTTAICSLSCWSLGEGCIIERRVSEGAEMVFPSCVATLHAKSHFSLPACPHYLHTFIHFVWQYQECRTCQPNLARILKVLVSVMTHSRWHKLLIRKFNLSCKYEGSRGMFA